MFDLDGAGVHTGHAGHTGVHRLGVDHRGTAVGDDRFLLAAGVEILAVGFQVEDDVPRIERAVGGLGRTDRRTATALGTGVLIEDFLPGEVIDGLGVGRVQVRRDVGQALPCFLVARDDVRKGGDHVEGLGVGDPRDEEEGEQRVGPPREPVERLGVGTEIGGRAVLGAGGHCGFGAREADSVEHRRESVADEAHDFVVRNPGDVDPEPLEQEAADAEREQRPDEDIVLVGGVSIPETGVADPVAAVHRHSDADDEEEPQRVDHELVGEVEVTVPKRHVEEFLRGVLLGHQDQRRDE